MLYQRWNPRARLSLIKKVCENTKPCCSSPKKIGPSRPGHTWARGRGKWEIPKLVQRAALDYINAEMHHHLPHSLDCGRRPGAPRWTAAAVWGAGGSGSECLFHHQRLQSLGETQEEIGIPVWWKKKRYCQCRARYNKTLFGRRFLYRSLSCL